MKNKKMTKECLIEELATLRRHISKLEKLETEHKKAEEALHKSEKRYRTLFEGANDAIFIVEKDTFIECNEMTLRMFGCKKRKDIIGLRPWDFSPPRQPDGSNSRKKALELIFAALDTKPQRFYWKHLRKDRTPFDAEVSLNRLDIDGKSYIQAIVRDITERKQAEEELQKSEHRFRTLIEETTDAVFCYEYDPPISVNLPIKDQIKKLYNGVLVECNDVCARYYGVSRKEDVLGKGLTDNFGAAPGELDGLFMEFIQDGYRSVDAEGVEETEDGSKRYYLNNGHGVIENGMLVRVWGAYRDITEQKKTEIARHKSEERLAGFMNSAEDSFYLLDSALNFVEVNKKALELIGKKREEIIGKNITEIVPDVKESGRYDKHLEVLRIGKPFIIDHFVPHPRFGNLHFILKSFKVGDGLGVIATDITRRKEAEEEILNYQKNLRSLALKLSLTEEQERRNIATYIHDQIGQKLALAKMKLGSLDESLLDAEYHKTKREIRDLLEETIQDTRNLTFELSPPILYELGIEQSIEWLVDQFREKHELQFEFSADGKAKPLDDDIRVILFQAVRELLMNVVKHSKATGAKISVLRKGEEILVRVDDNGVGFDTSMLQPFSPKKGGFGLFNIRERLKDFDGHLDIQSKAGQGTQITLKAPFKLPEKTLKKKK